MAPPADKGARARLPPSRACGRHGGRSGQDPEGTKQAMLVGLLGRAEGATIAEVVATTGWQPHAMRGAFAGALEKRLGLTIEFEKVDGRGRVYRIAAEAACLFAACGPAETGRPSASLLRRGRGRGSICGLASPTLPDHLAGSPRPFGHDLIARAGIDTAQQRIPTLCQPTHQPVTQPLLQT